MLPHSLLLSLTAPGRADANPESPWPVDDRPDVVGVRTGRLGTRTVRVPVSDVVEVRPAEERLVLRSREEPESPGVMNELRSLLHATRAGTPPSVTGQSFAGRA